MPLHPITDKAEVSVEFPENLYIGEFGRHCQFDAVLDRDSVGIRLVRPGDDRREAVIHLHYGLFADILVELAGALARHEPLDEVHRSELIAAGRQFCAALEPRDSA